MAMAAFDALSVSSFGQWWIAVADEICITREEVAAD
jgi:hypothetical protein